LELKENLAAFAMISIEIRLNTPHHIFMLLENESRALPGIKRNQYHLQDSIQSIKMFHSIYSLITGLLFY